MQAAVHGPVPSVSGQAVLTMPVLVPMSDLIGLSRQVVVLAYQYGAGLTELITPTNGALMAVTAAAGVKYGDWLDFAVPVYLALLVLGGLGLRRDHAGRSRIRGSSSRDPGPADSSARLESKTSVRHPSFSTERRRTGDRPRNAELWSRLRRSP